jgi:capsular exopolysaccharide synthesis family protein
MREMEKQLGLPLDRVGNGYPTLLEEPILDVTPDDTAHLLDYWEVVLKQRWTVAIALLVVFTTVAIGTLKKKPIYEAAVTIDIEPEQPNVVNFKEVAQVSTNSYDIDSFRETQYRILASRSLAERVVSDLELYRRPEFYKRRFLWLFESDPEKLPPSGALAPPDTSADYYRNSVANFMRATGIDPVRRSNLVEVSFDSADPQLASRVANKLAEDYIQQNLEVKWDETEKASQWLRGKLVELKGKIEKAEESLQVYARANSILYVNEKQSMATERLEQLSTEYTKVQAERYQKQSLYSLVEAGKTQDLPDVLSNKLIQDLEERLADAQKEYAQLLATVKPDFPKAREKKRQVDTLQAAVDKQKQAVAQTLVLQYRSAVAREKYLVQALADQKKEVNDLAEKSVQYNILKREVDTNHQLYDGLLQRMKEAQVSSTSTATNIRVVDNAEVPKSPVSPRVLLNLALGIVLGLGLGIGLGFFQEYLDKTLKTPDEVEKLLRLPSLGVLPRFAPNGAHAAEDGKFDALARSGEVAVAPALQTNAEAVEAFRSLRTSILLSANPVPKLLLVTSALPGEGKTTTTLNLGATLASLGSRVVIVDCDMRRPACHRSTGVKNSPGFVQCLTGRVSLAEAVLPVPGVPNLSVVPCGPIPPNPAEVLSTPLAAELLRKLCSEFEYVLVDSPPLLSVADSRILATITEATVLVTRAFESPYDAVRRARNLLYGAGARILGVALNDVDLRRHGYGGHDHYHYGYGYGYGNYTAEESDRPETT